MMRQTIITLLRSGTNERAVRTCCATEDEACHNEVGRSKCRCLPILLWSWSAMTDEIAVRRDGLVAQLTLNRPEAFNALNPELVDGLVDQLSALAGDEQIRTIVITGAGR